MVKRIFSVARCFFRVDRKIEFLLTIPFFAFLSDIQKKLLYLISPSYRQSQRLEWLLKQSALDKRHMDNNSELNVSIIALHSKTFPKYKGIYFGKEVVIVATGPTLQLYNPIANAIHIGVNRAVLCDKVKLDYLFLVDYINVKPFIDLASNKECKKFYGLFQEYNYPMHIPDSYALRANAERYYINPISMDMFEMFHYDISTKALPCFWSVTFQAVSFALYTNPSKLYLVGCDATYDIRFNNDPITLSDESKQQHKKRNMDGWHKLKTFANVYYPETEIISINPIGLKGLFNDVFKSTAD